MEIPVLPDFPHPLEVEIRQPEYWPIGPFTNHIRINAALRNLLSTKEEQHFTNLTQYILEHAQNLQLFPEITNKENITEIDTTTYQNFARSFEKIGHDFGNPLTAGIGFHNMVTSRPNVPVANYEKLYSSLQRAQNTIDSASNILGKLFDRTPMTIQTTLESIQRYIHENREVALEHPDFQRTRIPENAKVDIHG
ncbi:MAG TPA: hypothetical protein VMR41_02220 [Patescibacteria group bacterium]|nr:hypothetical protein [Patescibacteria group bacterium]